MSAKQTKVKTVGMLGKFLEPILVDYKQFSQWHPDQCQWEEQRKRERK
jgi:hypothetical protein